MTRSNSSAIARTISPGLHVATLSLPEGDEFFVTATPLPSEAPESLFARTAATLNDHGAAIISQEVYGSRYAGSLRAIEAAFGAITWPVNWVEEGHDTGLCGVQTWAVSGATIDPIVCDGHVLGTAFHGGAATFCRIGGVRPHDSTAPRGAQAMATLEGLCDALRQGGMDFSQVARTWFYNDDILAWYDEFNGARDAFFRDHKIFDGLVPASTGIGGRSAGGSSVMAGLLAIAPEDDGAVAAVPSPLQCPALEYGSSFSRAVEYVSRDHKRLYVSGTASIETGGATVFVGDVAGQVRHTFEVVKAILGSRGMDWGDVVRGVAYLRNATDARAYTQHCWDHGLHDLPIILTESVICRDDLLFELEVDAICKH
jgi:enamine deaminase RidA (YjgF/YER057c/UK114 family)